MPLSLMPVTFVLLWATGFIAAKFGLPYAGPMTFLLWRCGLVVLCMTLLALLFRARWPGIAKAKHIAVAGVLLQAGYLGGVFASIAHGMPAGLSALIVSMQPVLTAIMGPLTGERVSLRQWGGFALGTLGVLVVVWDKLHLDGVGPLTVGLNLLALFSITAGAIYQKKFCGANDLRTQSVVQFAAAFVVLLPFGLMFETLAVNWTPQFGFALGWAVLALSLGSISLLLLMIRHGAVTQVASLFYLVPAVTAIMAYLMFDERLGVQALAGFVIALTGVALVVAQPGVRKTANPK
jgi:drug/metabolite transporter (DMT)-like permease